MKRKYFPQFDTLRFFSILAIILYHYRAARFPGGFLAVDTFFVLSGFLITNQLEKKLEQGQTLNLWASLKKRWKSIFIPMAIFIVISLILLFLFAPQFLTNIRPTALSSLFFVNNWQQIFSGQSYFAQYLNPSIFTHLWYLSVYFQFIVIYYLYYQVVRPRVSRSWNFRINLIVAAISALAMAILFTPGEDPSRVYYGTDTRLFSFLIGAILAQIGRSRRFSYISDRMTRVTVDVSIFALLVFAVFFILNLGDSATFAYRGGMVVFDVIIALTLLLISQNKGWITTLLTFKPTAWLGKRSFGAYLCYYPIFILFYNNTTMDNFFTRSLLLQMVTIIVLGIILQGLVDQPTSRLLSSHALNFHVLDEKRRRSIANSASLAVRGLLAFAGLLIIIGAPSESAAEDSEQAANERAQQIEEKNQANIQEESPESQDLDSLKEDFEEYKAGLSEEQSAYYNYLNEDEALFAYQEPLTYVGDSITLMATDPIYTFSPRAIVTASVGLQLTDAITNIQQLANAGQLNEHIVLALGSNGSFAEDQAQAIIDTIGPDHQVYLVTTHVDRPWREEVNSIYEDIASNNDNVHLLDFNGYFSNIEDNYTWYDQDGVHFLPEGSTQWTAFIIKSIYGIQ